MLRPLRPGDAILEQVNDKNRPILLAVETSGDICGVAVLRNGVFVAEHTFRHGMHLSEHLIGHIDSVLKDADAVLADVSAFAVGIGPGSFTGTRIGVMTVKTLASVQHVPIYGIDSLSALAEEYRGQQNILVVPVLPCRAGTVYAAGWIERSDGMQNCLPAKAYLLGELSVSISDVLNSSAEAARSVLFCGAATTRYTVELHAGLTGTAAETAIRISFGAADFPRTRLIAALAWERLQTGDPGEDALDLVPLYISPPPISTPRPENAIPILREV